MEEKALSLFPYKYYTIQRDFCREFTRIITSIPSDGSARIGILESPTGTVQYLAENGKY
jgi:Rad3-related DNA helicase